MKESFIIHSSIKSSFKMKTNWFSSIAIIQILKQITDKRKNQKILEDENFWVEMAINIVSNYIKKLSPLVLKKLGLENLLLLPQPW